MSGFPAKVGIRARLQIAFSAVSGTSLIAAAVAILSFSAAERGGKYMAGHEVPLMTDAMRLSATSGGISTAAARFASAKSPSEQEAIGASINQKDHDLAALMERLRRQA